MSDGTPEDIRNKDANKLCAFYNSKSKRETQCVSKTRIKNFKSTTQATIIKNRGYTYNILDSKKILIYKNNTHIQYKILLDKNSDNIFILFNSGQIFESGVLYGTPMNTIMDQLSNEIIEYAKNINNFIFCGHSQGCVFAILLGIALIKKNPQLFLDKCYIIGSAPYKCIKFEDQTLFIPFFKKIQIFVSSVIINSENKFYDAFFQNPDELDFNDSETLYSFYPITLFDMKKYTLLIINNQTELKSFSRIDDIHEWKQNYYNVLSLIFQL